MKHLVIIGGIILWCLLFAAVFWGGSALIDSIARSQKKNWGRELGDPASDKWMFRFYVICFFVGIPILAVLALFQN